MQRIDFYQGEVKQVTAVVKAKNPYDTVVVTSAKYSLTSAECDKEKTEVESGECEIDGNKLTILLSTEECGVYELKITVNVGRETIIQKAYVYVGR